MTLYVRVPSYRIDSIVNNGFRNSQRLGNRVANTLGRQCYRAAHQRRHLCQQQWFMMVYQSKRSIGAKRRKP
jgi:hypothetical protein